LAKCSLEDYVKKTQSQVVFISMTFMPRIS
jgi:hypothetical protein